MDENSVLVGTWWISSDELTSAVISMLVAVFITAVLRRKK